jgi:hypothetical protein
MPTGRSCSVTLRAQLVAGLGCLVFVFVSHRGAPPISSN